MLRLARLGGAETAMDPAERQSMRRAARRAFQRHALERAGHDGPVRADARGKPFASAADGAPRDDLAFSASGSGDWALVAIRRRDASHPSCAVGADIESLAPSRLARLFPRGAQDAVATAALLHPDERDAVRAARDPLRRFLEIWVRKEAVAKLRGCGLDDDFAAFDARAPADCRVCAFQRPGAWLGAVALPLHGRPRP